jgi:hypothetical protein
MKRPPPKREVVYRRRPPERYESGRVCVAEACTTVLSIYNEDERCARCEEIERLERFEVERLKRLEAELMARLREEASVG